MLTLTGCLAECACRVLNRIPLYKPIYSQTKKRRNTDICVYAGGTSAGSGWSQLATSSSRLSANHIAHSREFCETKLETRLCLAGWYKYYNSHERCLYNFLLGAVNFFSDCISILPYDLCCSFHTCPASLELLDFSFCDIFLMFY